MSNIKQGKAQQMLADHLRDNPRLSLTDAMRWLNNQRYMGERMGVNWLEAQKIFDALKRAPPGQKPLPVEVAPRDVQKPLQAPFAEVARLSLAQPPPSPPIVATPPKPLGNATRAARIARVDDLVLAHPEWTHAEVADALIAEFGESIDSNIVGAALKVAREAAGLKYHSKSRQKVADMPPPSLVAPAVQIPPDELLKEAGRVLKSLAQRMQWASVTVKVTHDGTLSYSSEPMPVMALKGELKL